jgi:hypothetical protein
MEGESIKRRFAIGGSLLALFISCLGVVSIT